MVPLVNIMLGEIVFGGVGAGMYGILIFVMLSVFIAGLMVGRTPEYLGKKIEAYDVKMAMLTCFNFSAAESCAEPQSPVVAVQDWRLSNNAGPTDYPKFFTHLRPAPGNNGSAFAGLGANTLWYNSGHRCDHADWAVLHDDADAGRGGQPGPQEDRTAFIPAPSP